MHPTSFFGFLLVATSILHALRPGQKTAKVALLFGALTFAAGLLGACIGVSNALHYLPQAPRGEELQVLALGVSESLHDLVLALMLVMVAGLITVVGALRGSTSATGGLTAHATTGE